MFYDKDGIRCELFINDFKSAEINIRNLKEYDITEDIEDVVFDGVGFKFIPDDSYRWCLPSDINILHGKEDFDVESRDKQVDIRKMLEERLKQQDLTPETRKAYEEAIVF